MKKGIVVFCLLLLSVPVIGQIKIHDQDLETKIDQVKVFMTGAELVRTPSIVLKQGRNKLVFTGISAYADPSSLQFKAVKDFRIISVNTEMDYLNYKRSNKRITSLTDSLSFFSLEVRNLTDVASAYRAELEILKKNQSIKGQNSNLTVDELKKMADFVRERTLRIQKDMSKNSAEQAKLNLEKRRVQAQLSELNYSETNRSNQIILIIDADQEIQIKPNLKYVVSNCGWASIYDVVAKDVSGDIKLVYKGQVFNNTGNDWNYVDLVLSTGNPNMSASAPVLPAWFLNYNSYGNIQVKGTMNKKRNYAVPVQNNYQQIQQNGIQNIANNEREYGGLDLINSDAANAPAGDIGRFNAGYISGVKTKAKAQVKYRTLQVSQLSSDFEIDRKYTIPADAKAYTVEIAQHNLKATFSHVAVPKMNKDAFLLANITGWEDLDLVPGPTKVYFGGNYVGQSEIDTRNVDDTLGLSFGRDAKVLVTRKSMKEFTSQKVIGNNKKDSYSYEITVKNNRNSSISLDLYDQVPISQHSDITVTVDEISAAQKDEATGELDWTVKLNAGESKSYKISFTIKYPKNKKITVKKFRAISAPSF
jgi:hypothetical protein